MQVACSLSNYEFENIVEFLDSQSQGFIMVVDV